MIFLSVSVRVFPDEVTSELVESAKQDGFP